MSTMVAGRVAVAEPHTLTSPADCQQVYQDILHHRTSSLTVAFDWTRTQLT